MNRNASPTELTNDFSRNAVTGHLHHFSVVGVSTLPHTISYCKTPCSLFIQSALNEREQSVVFNVVNWTSNNVYF